MEERGILLTREKIHFQERKIQSEMKKIRRKVNDFRLLMNVTSEQIFHHDTKINLCSTGISDAGCL